MRLLHNILPKQILQQQQRILEFKMCHYPCIHNTSPIVNVLGAKIFHLACRTGGFNLHSQLLYAASSYILHANETINTPTHLLDASLWQAVLRHYMSLAVTRKLGFLSCGIRHPGSSMHTFYMTFPHWPVNCGTYRKMFKGEPGYYIT